MAIGTIVPTFQKIKTETRVFFKSFAKLPTNDSDKSRKSRPLPMPYQTSLGAHDLLADISANYQRLKFALGYQHPFGNYENSHLLSWWPDKDNALDYFESNKLCRPDIQSGT